MAALPQVLRLPRSDGDDASFVLLHVSSNGSPQLDLTLVATEGSYPYVSKCQFRSSSSFLVLWTDLRSEGKPAEEHTSEVLQR